MVGSIANTNAARIQYCSSRELTFLPTCKRQKKAEVVALKEAREAREAAKQAKQAKKGAEKDKDEADGQEAEQGGIQEN